ncbi:hypothetical protein G4B88_020699 [Cannabis sativa]|uniref:Uncharacterized protein n=1 Tax=Cannabis sativa TaxID=3483 RepID=A0A7J6HLE9_CANSA|nr:hypothetical protein G4B88_020699 [Cannabis sativa]
MANDIPGHILRPAPNGMSSKVKLLSFSPILWIPSYCPCINKYFSFCSEAHGGRDKGKVQNCCFSHVKSRKTIVLYFTLAATTTSFAMATIHRSHLHVHDKYELYFLATMEAFKKALWLPLKRSRNHYGFEGFCERK